MKFVYRHFVIDPHTDQKTCSESSRKSDKIDKKRSFISQEIPVCNKKVMAYHDRWVDVATSSE